MADINFRGSAAREDDIVGLIELLFFAYRDFVSDPDRILAEYGFGRAHHRIVHFVGRNPGMTVASLLDILGITKQSLARVLKDLIDGGFVIRAEGTEDRRQRLLHLTPEGEVLRQRLVAPQIARIARALEEAGPEARSHYRSVLFHLISPENREAALARIEQGLIAEGVMAAEAELPHLLIVDDDRRIRELLRSYLSENGFRVTVAGTAAEARRAMAGLSFDLLVLDIMMPGESGLDLAAALRAENPAPPILMLSALAEPEDRIRGLTAGSDDYLPKPFEPQELLLRIRSILRRSAQPAPAATEVRFGAFVFNLARGELKRDGELVRLTASERDLLRLLAQRTGAPASRADLSEPGAGEDARSVDVRINRLRQKIEDDPANPLYLRTLRGLGYALAID